MGDFRSDSGRGFRGNRSDSRGYGGGRGGGFGRDRDGSRGGFGGGRDRDRRPVEMHDVVCDKCGKDCQVPFKPSGNKPVLCSDCFTKDGGSSRGSGSRGSGSRGSDRSTGTGAGAGMSQEQFKEINTKLDKK